MKKTLLLLVFSIFTIGLFADAKGDEIARKMDEVAEPNDRYSISSMILIDKNNNRKVRKLENYSKKTSKGTNSFIEFLEPADVKGSRFLTIGYDDGDDDQRLYLPALGKVRKISSSKKGGSFMGSDLNYYDMEDRNFNDATYKYLRDEEYNGVDCFVIESYPTDEDAPYSKTQTWVDKSNYIPRKVVCFDKKGRKEKTIAMVEVKKIKGYWITLKMVVDNHLKGTKTLLSTESPQLNAGLKDDIFSVQNLTR